MNYCLCPIAIMAFSLQVFFILIYFSHILLIYCLSYILAMFCAYFFSIRYGQTYAVSMESYFLIALCYLFSWFFLMISFPWRFSIFIFLFWNRTTYLWIWNAFYLCFVFGKSLCFQFYKYFFVI